MSKTRILMLAAGLALASNGAFAMEMMDDDKACGDIAKACMEAGFSFNSEKEGKKFWMDCMKPIILGHTVTGVKVEASTVKSCRAHKEKEMKEFLKELEKAH